MAERRFISEAGVEEIIHLKEDGQMGLIGCKCKDCGFISFPAGNICIKCGSENTEKTELASTGTLYTYTQTMRPVNHMPAKTITGYIDLEDGVRIFAPIEVVEGDKPRIGSKMTVIFKPLWEEQDGTQIIGYAGRQEKS